jgi:penicillin-binding protein 1B
LSGAHLALPVWTEFMKRAVALPGYSDAKSFTPPSGVVQLTLDKVTNQIATPACPNVYQAAFIDGTQPTQTCEQGVADHRNVFQKIFGLGSAPPSASPVSNSPNGPLARPVTAESDGQSGPEKPKKKPGFWGRLFGSKSDNKDDNSKDKSRRPEGPTSSPP